MNKEQIKTLKLMIADFHMTQDKEDRRKQAGCIIAYLEGALSGIEI